MLLHSFPSKLPSAQSFLLHSLLNSGHSWCELGDRYLLFPDLNWVCPPPPWFWSSVFDRQKQTKEELLQMLWHTSSAGVGVLAAGAHEGALRALGFSAVPIAGRTFCSTVAFFFRFFKCVTYPALSHQHLFPIIYKDTDRTSRLKCHWWLSWIS